MVIDQNGNVYLAGTREDSTIWCTETKPLVIKLDTAGNLLWLNAMDFLRDHTARTTALYGKWLYVAGPGSIFVARLDTATGIADWYEEYTSTLGQWVNNTIFDENGNMYLAGGGDPGSWEVLCIDSIGTERWRFDAEPEENNDFGMISIILDSQGNLFAGGSGSNDEYPVVYKLDTLGNLIWAWKDTLTEYDDGTVSGLVPDGQGGVYVQEWFTFTPDTGGLYTNITSVVHLTEGQAIAEDGGKGQVLKVLMAQSGFWVSGYEGEAQIYDPAGRLVLSREIKGKTLMGPLSPGVYFVVAGKERAKVAVR